MTSHERIELLHILLEIKQEYGYSNQEMTDLIDTKIYRLINNL